VLAQRGLGCGLDVELAVDLGPDEGAAKQLDAHPDLAEAVGSAAGRGPLVDLPLGRRDGPAHPGG